MEILASVQTSAQLVEALMAQVDRFTSRHAGFVGSRIQIGEHEGEVHLQLFWLTKEHGEQALACPVAGETDLLQFVRDFQVRQVIFRTSVAFPGAPSAL
ncbi:hypothetical protein BZK31_21605 [Pseudomonas floridensis]|uniref:ABM domain-containing protein n=2 Tax=Pseudomonas floridensis TaxID=1958950 RepID=A0A1X0N1A0_9PSED|nr:hypothetical protein BZK31_21605 [Pseudomonas floridensis]